jgi:hypothetical protein
MQSHSMGAYIDVSVVAEVLGGADLYPVRYLRKISSSVRVTSAIVSNGTFYVDGQGRCYAVRCEANR